MRVPGIFFSVILLSAVTGSAQSLPLEIDERFDSIISAADDEDFVGSFTMTTNSLVQKPGGKKKQETSMIIEVERTADGATKNRLISMIEDGEDRTDAYRSDVEDNSRVEEEDEDESEGEFELKFPFGDDARCYVFSRPARFGATVKAGFEPTEECRNDVGAATGTAAWDAESLDPIWVEYRPLEAPSPMREMTVRAEFERQGDEVYMTRLITAGRVRILLLKREFRLDIRFSEIKPQS